MPKPLSAETFARIHELETRRKELESEARQLKSEAARLQSTVVDALDEAGRTSAKRGDHQVLLETVPGRISWKDECTKRLEPGELEEIQASVAPTRRFRISAVASMLICVLMAGCLKQADSLPEMPFPADPIFEFESEQETTDDPVEVEPTGYTGAVVWTSDDCTPCHYLTADLKAICEKFPHWSYSYCRDDGDFNRQADWIIRTTDDGEVPRIEYWKDGQIVDETHGYTSSEYWPRRRDTLIAIFDKHPSR